MEQIRSAERAPVVIVDALVKRYGDSLVVRGIDLAIRRGEVFGLLGPNGAGKTTTLECVVGLRRPTTGTVRVLGLDPATERTAFTQRVAVQPQAASLFEGLTTLETLTLFASFHRYPLPPAALLTEVGLANQRDTRVRHLSGGQTRRLLLGVALVGDPEFVVLDEPSAGLDPAAKQQLWTIVSALRERGVTVLMSTHDMDEATTLCDRVAILASGSIVALGTPGELAALSAAEGTVQFTVPADADPDALARLAESDRIITVPVNGGIRVTISTPQPDELLRAVTFDLRVDAREFAVHRGSLQDLFIQFAVADGENR